MMFPVPTFITLARAAVNMFSIIWAISIIWNWLLKPSTCCDWLGSWVLCWVDRTDWRMISWGLWGWYWRLITWCLRGRLSYWRISWLVRRCLRGRLSYWRISWLVRWCNRTHSWGLGWALSYWTPTWTSAWRCSGVWCDWRLRGTQTWRLGWLGVCETFF